MIKRYLLLIVVFVFVLSACDTVAGDAAPVVEQYLQAKVAADADGIGALLCSELERSLPIEISSYASADATIQNMVCTQTSSTDNSAIVSCEGEIVVDYGNETPSFELATYRVLQEDGEWRWCGETSE